jgi:membrane-associated phospholipid phosphatase
MKCAVFRFTFFELVFRLLLVLFLFLPVGVFSQQRDTNAAGPSLFDGDFIPLSAVFSGFGRNALDSIRYNYGLNFIGAALGTWGFIESGADWKWNRFAYNNSGLACAGYPALYAGAVVPAAAPILFYMIGRNTENKKLQLAGLAMTQSLMLTLGFTSAMKLVSGRATPGLINDFNHERRSGPDFSGEFNWFSTNFFDGWPSGHTATAFSAAAALTEIYDAVPVKISAYAYALLVGLSVSLNVHWASEVFAGALIGYAVGKTVGRSFSGALGRRREEKLSFYMSPNAAGLILRL